MKLYHSFLNYGVYCYYQTETSCDSSGCKEDGICRCSIISYACVNDVDICKISDSIYDIYFEDSISTKRNTTINSVLYDNNSIEMNKYIIDRILRINKLWNSDSWYIDIINGYYGQELDQVFIERNLSIKIESQLDSIFEIGDPNKMIEYLLNLEYGGLLPELSGGKYEIVEILKDNIIFGSKNHLKNILKGDMDHYSDKKYTGIRGIVIQNGDKYRLIDGYHRCSSTQDKMVKVLKVKPIGKSF